MNIRSPHVCFNTHSNCILVHNTRFRVNGPCREIVGESGTFRGTQLPSNVGESHGECKVSEPPCMLLYVEQRSHIMTGKINTMYGCTGYHAIFLPFLTTP